ncbi:hypothetical protein QJS04_geneDACA019951 [Acorus gramineus]|uniref:Uncharacterized protein n=1 Tax=Acorus gramineus TaxID=55184 RepID=A0AAV9AH34_ACOGR|nr:hypothetical protein QJS04_geneDACA019951 [Acorus gramineus]
MVGRRCDDPQVCVRMIINPLSPNILGRPLRVRVRVRVWRFGDVTNPRIVLFMLL